MPAEKPSFPPLLAGFLSFAAFETAAYYLLRLLTSGLGERNQYQPENTVVSNWVLTSAFVVLHLALVIAVFLGLNNWLGRQHRRQLLGWFYVGILMSFGLLLPLWL